MKKKMKFFLSVEAVDVCLFVSLITVFGVFVFVVVETLK